MNEENEDYQNELGELSEPTFEERGGFPPQAKGVQYQPGQQLPPDMAYQNEANAGLGTAVLGGPALGTYVTTTYDARPINARDFFTSAINNAETDGSTAGEIPADFSFTVPQGYVAVLRGVAWDFSIPSLADEGSPSPDYNYTFTVRLQVDGIAVPNYDDIAGFGAFLNDLVPCYVLANEGQTITLSVRITSDNALTIGVNQKLYGNLLLSRGLPTNFEPGSLTP